MFYKASLCSIIFLCILTTASSQDTVVLDTTHYISGHILTPRNTEVVSYTLLYDDFTIPEALAKDSVKLIDHEGALLLESSTLTYNCHGYAWNIVEGGSAVVLDGYYDLNPYWEDGSYVQVMDSTLATKIVYQIDSFPNYIDHSVICTDDPDTVISKWGYDGPLVKHHLDDCIWKASDYTLRYYKLKPGMITGPETICDEETFEIDSTTSTTRFNWSPSSKLDLGTDSTSNSIDVEPISSEVYGDDEFVQSIISTVYEDVDEGEDVVVVIDTLRKEGLHVSNQPSNVQIHVPVEPIYGEVEAMVWASSDPGEESYDWQVSGGTIISETGSEMTLIADCPSRRGITISVKAINDCGESSWVYKNVDVDCSGGINPLSILPNPADGYIDLTIDQTLSESVQYYDGKYEISVLDQSGILKFSTSTFDTHFRINTQSFIDGIYYVILKYAGKRYGRQLIISH